MGIACPLCPGQRAHGRSVTALVLFWRTQFFTHFVFPIGPLVATLTICHRLSSSLSLSLGQGYSVKYTAGELVMLECLSRKSLKISLASENIPALSFSCAINSAFPVMAILDFPLFPRRLAKTKLFGTGAIDFGVGGFVLGTAVVCPEIRRKCMEGSRFCYLTKSLYSGH